MSLSRVLKKRVLNSQLWKFCIKSMKSWASMTAKLKFLISWKLGKEYANNGFKLKL